MYLVSSVPFGRYTCSRTEACRYCCTIELQGWRLKASTFLILDTILSNAQQLPYPFINILDPQQAARSPLSSFPQFPKTRVAAIGNLGRDKSTFLDMLFSEPIFRSDISLGTFLTTHNQTHPANTMEYVDTTGFDSKGSNLAYFGKRL